MYYSPILQQYIFTRTEKILLMILLGTGTGYTLHFFSEFVKNRKSRRTISKKFQEDPNLILKDIRGGDIFHIKNLEEFDIEEDFGLKLFKTLKKLTKKLNRSKLTKERAIKCVELIKNTTTVRVNNRQLIKLILKSLNLNLTKNDILSITPGLLSLIIMNGGFTKILLENVSNNVFFLLKRELSCLEAVNVTALLSLVIPNIKTDISVFLMTGALTYFAFNSKILWLTNLIKAKTIGSLIGLIIMSLSLLNTCFEFVMPMVSYQVQIPAKEKVVHQTAYKMLPEAKYELRDIEDLPKIFVTTSPTLIVDNRHFSQDEIKKIRLNWDKKPGGLMKIDYPREIKQTKTLNLEILQTGDIKIDSSIYNKIINSKSNIPLQIKEKNLLNDLKSKRFFDSSSNISKDRKFNRKINGLHDLKKNQKTPIIDFKSDEIIDAEFKHVTPKIREKNN